MEVAAISQLIDPEMAIPLRISNLTGILPVMVKGKPTIQQIAPQLKELLGDLPVVAHNASFDISFLQAAFAGLGLRAANPAYCTAELSRVVLPRAKNHRLATLVKELEVELERHHRAEDDARACGEIYLKLVEQVRTMDPGLLRFILNLGEPGNWSLAPIFRQALEEKEALGEKGKALMQWIRPYDGQLHQPEEQAPEGEPSAIDPEKVLGVLGPGGVVSDAFPSYEHRPAQMEMALAVTQAFNKGSHLLMEAGTGTGKSLAYLMPAIAWAKRNGEKVAIATHTINLQEQLWEKDIPFLMDALTGTKWEGFKAALVKGRPNYICLRKWEEGVIGADFLSSPEERSFQIRLASWLSETDTGDKAELNFASEDEKLWTDVQSEAETCLGPRCKWYRNHCFAYRARRRARDADLMVLNHAMLFADINTGNEILPAYRHLILDEAHHVEDVATNALGIRLENWEIFSALIHLFRSAGQGFLPTLRRKIPPEQRIAARPPVGLPSEDQVEKLIDLTMAARVACDEMFRLCAQLVENKGGSEEEAGRALRLTDTVRMGSLWEALDSSRANAVFRLKQLGQGMAALAEAVEAMEPPLRDAESVLVDIQKQSGILVQSAKQIDGVLLKPAEDVVTWIEVGTRRDSPRVVLRSAPIDVGELLEEKLFDKLRSVVMTSATLSVSGGFEHVKRRLGLANLPPSRVSEGIMSSPFAYRRQALLLIPEDLPNPKLAGDKEFTRTVREFIGEYVVRAGGRTLVLFTSHRQLRQVYAELKDLMESEGIFLLGQGLDGSRGRLVEEFKTAEKAVLFGSASFWEGVDIPGDGLTSVILVKLPFSPPDEPVMEARTEDLQRRGLSSFAHLSLPQAVIKFKQGFGRLVRTKTDRGVVIVLDNRISPRQTRYGSQFLRSLPGPSVYTGPITSVLERALDWLNLEIDS
ncbi:MAG: ATP-dependent helicase [Symbiobacteriaceae bacterium]|nr:ATP-dependent helicase [Symbiobacteriaceae bacterium]